MRWWFGRAVTNYAVITGRLSGIAVVDVDDVGALRWLRWNLPETPWIVKTSRGWHCYYRFPVDVEIGNRARVAGMKLDVRGEGGYVIGPGSRHASGFVYQFLGNWRARGWRVPPLNPAVLHSEAPRPRPAAPAPLPLSDAVTRARAYLRKVPAPCVGAGSDLATFVAACRLVRGFRVSPDEAVALLQEWAPDFDAWWLRKKVSTALAYGKETHGGKL